MESGSGKSGKANMVMSDAKELNGIYRDPDRE